MSHASFESLLGSSARQSEMLDPQGDDILRMKEQTERTQRMIGTCKGSFQNAEYFLSKDTDHSVDGIDLPGSGLMINYANAFLGSINTVIDRYIVLERFEEAKMDLDILDRNLDDMELGAEKSHNGEASLDITSDVPMKAALAKVLVTTDVLTVPITDVPMEAALNKTDKIKLTLDDKIEINPMGADGTVLADYEVNDKLKNIKQIKLITTRQFKMETVKEAKGFWRETQLSSAELSTEILKTKPHHGATSNLTKWITRLQNLNNFWREKHVNKCSIKTDEGFICLACV